MAITLLVTIKLKDHISHPSEADEFRIGFEKAIEEYEIGKVVGSGGMVDGSSVDVSFTTDDEDHARFFLQDYLGHCGVYEDTKIELE